MKTFFSLVSGLLFAFPSFAQTTATQSIPLASGWNLLVLQIQPTNPNPASVFDSLGVNFAAAWTFDNATRQWSRFARPGTMEATNNSIFSMAELQIGRGYWVYMNAPATWNLTGQIPAVSPPVLMTNGWNLVGIPTGRVPLPESVSMLSVLTAAGFDYDTILKWESGLYRKFTPADTDVDDFTLFDPNRGYWVRVKSGGTFSLQPRLLSSVRADVDVEPQGNYPSFEDLQISPSPVPLNPSNQTHIVFLSGEDTQQIAIANTGGGMLAWDIQWQPSDATNINWLQFSSVSGITTIENDVVQIFLDRTQLPKGTYTGTLVLRTSAGNRSFQVVANVGDLRGEWRGVAKISNVNGRHNEVADIDLHVDFFGDPTTPGLIRGLLDSRNSLLWPLDVPLVGHSGSLSENRITLGGAFILPPGDLNNPPYATFATGADLEDVDWNCNGTLDDINPYPFPLYRSVLLQGKLVSSSASEGLLVSGDYVETVYGMLRTPIRLEGTFTLRRENPKPFSNRRPVANVEDSNGVQPVVYKSFAPGSPLNIPVGLTTNSLSFITDLALQNISVDVDFGDAPASGVKFTLESPSGQQVILHNQANLGTLRSMSFPSLRNPVQSFDALINSGSPTRGNWKLIIQNSSGIGGKLYFWSLTLQGQPVFTVSGRVVDATTGAGIPGQVSLDGLPITAATVAGADGSFTFLVCPAFR
jgi:subtilisin-like proprotein convertase family protein